MHLEMPDSHPIAWAIRESVGDWGNGKRILLRLDEATPEWDLTNLLTLEVVRITHAAKRFEIELEDIAQRNRAMKRLSQWPEEPK